MTARLPRLGPIGRSSVQTLGVYGLRLVVQSALLLLVARYLGPHDFGEFAGVAALAFGLGTLSSFGLGFLVLGESAKSPEAGGEVLAQAIPATFLSAILLTPLYLWLAIGFVGSGADWLTICLIGVSELLLVPLLTLISQHIQGLGKIWFSQLVGTLPMLTRLTAIITCAALLPDGGLPSYAVAYVLASLAGLAVALLPSRTRIPLMRFALPSLHTLKEASAYAVMKFTALTPAEIDKALALRLLPAAEAGAYSLAARGLGIAVMPVVALVVSSQPRLFRQTGENPDAARKLVAAILGTSLAYGVAAGFLLAHVLGPVLIWVLGPDYAAVASALTVLGWAAPFLALRFAGGGIMIPLRRPLVRSSFEVIGIIVLVLSAFGGTDSTAGGRLALAVLHSEVIMAACFVGYLLISPNRRMVNGRV